MFLIQVLMQEIKPVVSENKRFEKRDVSMMRALLIKFGLSGLWRKARNHEFHDWVLWFIWKVSDWDLHEKFKLGIFTENEGLHYKWRWLLTASFWYSFNQGTTKRQILPIFFYPRETRVTKKVISKKWEGNQLFTSLVIFLAGS